MSIIQPKQGSAKQRSVEYRQIDPTANSAFKQAEGDKVFYVPEDRTPYSALEERAFGLAEVRISNGAKFTKRSIDVLRSLLFPNAGAKPNISIADQMSMMALLEYVLLPDVIVVYDPVGKHEDLNAGDVLWQFKSNGKDIVKQEPERPFAEADALDYAVSCYFSSIIIEGRMGVIKLKQALEDGKAKGEMNCAGQNVSYDMVKAKIQVRLVFVRDLLP